VWLANDEFFITHFPKKSAIDTGEPEEGKYHYVRSNKGWTSFSFHPTAEEPILPAWDMPSRAFPPRLSVTRLRGWEPDLDDLLIVTNSHTDTIVTVTSANKQLARGGPVNEYTMTEINEGQGAQVPRRVFGEEGDSVLIGEALDLSATEKLLRPISSNEEITEASHPLPAYMFLTYQGILSAYWIVWNRSIMEGKGYPGLVNVDSSASNTQASAPKTALSSKIPTPGSGNNAPATPSGKFGASPFASTTPATAFGKPAFGTPASSTPFGQAPPKPPAFGAPSAVGSASPFGQKPAFGAPSAVGSASLFGQAAGSTFGQPSKPTGAATGSTQPAFGTPAGPGKASPWGTSTSQTSSTPAGNPFASGGASSGFAKFGGNAPGSGSGFAGFSNTSGTSSGFAALGQQKSAFGGAPKTEQSFGSAPQTAGGLNGLAGGFKLGTTFQADPSAKTEDAAKPAAPTQGGFFGSDFSSMVPKAGLQPSKGPGDGGSTTPLSPAKKTSYFGTTPSAPSPVKKEPVDDAPLPPDFTKATKKSESVDDAPLPPDFTTFKPKSQPEDAPLPPDFTSKKSSKEAEDDMPPLAGSPGVEVESSLGTSPTPLTDDEEEEFSSDEESHEEGGEEHEGDEGDEEEGTDEEAEEEEENEEGRQQPTTLGKYVLQQPGKNASTDKPATTSKPSLFGAKPSTGQAAPSSCSVPNPPPSRQAPHRSLGSQHRPHLVYKPSPAFPLHKHRIPCDHPALFVLHHHPAIDRRHAVSLPCQEAL
jgi:nucleoporin NUP159